MRKINYFLLLFCLCGVVNAQEYQIDEIEDIAFTFFNSGAQYMPGNEGHHQLKQISSIDTISRNNSNYLFVANAENSAGWIILSNEKTYPSIIAHGDSGHFV